MNSKSLKRQRGLHTVEFAIVGGLFLVLLFGVIEIGRLLFSLNTLDETSRRAARLAAVCPINHSAIRRVAVFNGPETTGASPVLPGLDAVHVHVEYLDDNGARIEDPANNFNAIHYVRSYIEGYEHRLLIPLFAGPVTVPAFITVLPRESLGVSPEGTECFGTAT